MDTIKNKREILFLWDGQNFNPNGDMLKNNQPRFDDITNKAEASDVRIKRTIRDFALFKDEKIFVKEYITKDGFVADCKTAAEIEGIDNTKSEKDVMIQAQNYFDIRAFGTVMPLKVNTKNKDIASIHLTGAVQFGVSRTIHEAEIDHLKGTGAFSSGDKKAQATFREESFLKYGMFATYGIVSPANALKSGLTEKDYDNMLTYLWNGTKNLITRTKMGQNPRLLIDIKYKENTDTFIGNLHNLVTTNSDVEEIEYRDASDYTVEFDRLVKKIELFKDEIEEVRYFIEADFEDYNNIPSDWKKDATLK